MRKRFRVGVVQLGGRCLIFVVIWSVTRVAWIDEV
jgi:hypothetical protein